MVETTKGTDRLTFKYDYMGRRVEKCMYSNNTLTSKTLFVYDGFKCVEELDALDNNAVVMRHAWQPFDVGLDVIFASTDVNGTSYFLHDANKNVMQKTATNGTVLEKYVYAPFGGNAGEDNAHIGFSSELKENGLDMLCYNFRILNNEYGRWISRDLLEEFDGNNLYIFITNSPIINYDYLGNQQTITSGDIHKNGFIKINGICYSQSCVYNNSIERIKCLVGADSFSFIGIAGTIIGTSHNPILSYISIGVTIYEIDKLRKCWKMNIYDGCKVESKKCDCN